MSSRVIVVRIYPSQYDIHQATFLFVSKKVRKEKVWTYCSDDIVIDWMMTQYLMIDFYKKLFASFLEFKMKIYT